jgi:hypothetical protein
MAARKLEAMQIARLLDDKEAYDQALYDCTDVVETVKETLEYIVARFEEDTQQ